MRIGILTSWRVPCGIYQYSARYADALAALGHEPVILAGRADEHRSVPEESEHEVHDISKIGLWRDDRLYEFDFGAFSDIQLDAVHVQYQNMLFRQEYLTELARRCVRDTPIAITFHDNCIDGNFPLHLFDLQFTHRWNVGPASAEVIPFGIEDRRPVIGTFGLGRSQSHLIEPLCVANGWEFRDISSHESIHGGGQGWRTHADLIEWLRGTDAIVLWYPDVDQAGSSQAARTAIAARRPVFTNNTKWFEDLPTCRRATDDSLFLCRCQNLVELREMLDNHFERPYVEENSWTSVAQTMVDLFTKVCA